MLFHQLSTSLQIFLFQCLRLPEKLLRNRTDADMVPPMLVFRNVNSQPFIRHSNRKCRFACRTAKECVLKLAVCSLFGLDGFSHRSAVITFDIFSSCSQRIFNCVLNIR